MKTSFQTRHNVGLTLVELIVVVFFVIILAGLFWPGHIGGKQKATRITCVNNLREVGLGFRLWSGDNDTNYPMQLSTNIGGSSEFVERSQVYRHFQLLSNELGTPKLLICPAEKKRKHALNFESLKNTNISYFIGVDAVETNANMLMGGDRNITNGFVPRGGMLELTTNQIAGFTEELHERQGNVLIADGGVWQVSSARLRSEIIRNTGVATNRIFLP